MQRDQADAVQPEVVTNAITVAGTIAMRHSGLTSNMEKSTKLHQGNLVMIRRMCTHGEWRPTPIHEREVFHALPILVNPTASTYLLPQQTSRR